MKEAQIDEDGESSSHSNSPSPEYESWLNLRPDFLASGGLPPSPPEADEDLIVAHHRFCFQHMNELVTAQAEEMHLMDGIEVRDIIVPRPPQPSSGLPPELKSFSGAGADVKVRVYTPTSAPGPFPLVVFIASGGFLMGSESTDEKMCRELCLLSKVVVASIAYRRNQPFPAAHEDCWNAFTWLTQNASRTILADPVGRGLYVCGSSIGALLANYVVMRAADEGKEPDIGGLLLRSPVLLPGPDSAAEKLVKLSWEDLSSEDDEDMDDETPKLHKKNTRRFKFNGYNGFHSPLHSPGFLSRSFEHYKIPTKMIDHRYISPLVHDMAGTRFPPVYAQTSTLDITAHHSYILRSKLNEKGKDCNLDIYEGLPHYFWSIPRLPNASKTTVDLARGFLWIETLSNMKKWDCGISQDLDEWSKTSSQSEGAKAFRARRLCRVSGCGCFL